MMEESGLRVLGHASLSVVMRHSKANCPGSLRWCYFVVSAWLGGDESEVDTRERRLLTVIVRLHGI